MRDLRPIHSKAGFASVPPDERNIGRRRDSLTRHNSTNNLGPWKETGFGRRAATVRQPRGLLIPGKDRNRAEVTKDLLALVNSAGRTPGDAAHLILGAGDKLSGSGGRIAKDAKGLYTRRVFLDILNARCTPPVHDLEYDEAELDGVTYGVLTILPPASVHYLTQDLVTPKGSWRANSVLVRHGDQVGLASPEEIARLISRHTAPPHDTPTSSSDVELLEASLDPNYSPYRQRRQGDVIEIARVEETKNYTYSFPTIDFKLRNTGTAAAFLRRFQIEVLSAEIDPTPVLSFRAIATGKALSITVTNYGWGPRYRDPCR
jgi:hypothetical protein